MKFVNPQWEKIFEEKKVLVTKSHFIYTSGKHGDCYLNKDALYPDPKVTSALGLEFAQAFLNHDVECVVAPALGGIILSQWTAYHLGELSRKTVYSCYAEKTADGSFALKRGYETIVPGKRVLVVEDVLNTGGSVERVISLLRASTVVGVACICNRGDVKADHLNVPYLFSIADVKFPVFEPSQCPLCQAGVPFHESLGKSRG